MENNSNPNNHGATTEGPQVLALLFCDWANQTADGKYNLIGTFDQVFVPMVPCFTPPFFLFVRTLGTGPGQLEIGFQDPQGLEPETIQVTIEAKQADPDLPGILQFSLQKPMVVRQLGVHWAEVRYEGRVLGRAPLTVRSLPKVQP